MIEATGRRRQAGEDRRHRPAELLRRHRRRPQGRRRTPSAPRSTCQQLLDEFKEQDVDCVLIDLRGNGGGLLLEAISLSGLFIDTGPVVRVRDADGVLPYDDEDAGTAYDGPLAVLISHTSASASEIFAGVIKDYGRGLIVGDSSTYGKGTVQSIIDLNDSLPDPDAFPDLGALKLTIQQFYRANGMSTQVRGVAADIHIPSVVDHIEKLGEGEMDNALAFDKIDPLPHDYYNRVPSELVAKLEARSLRAAQGQREVPEAVRGDREAHRAPEPPRGPAERRGLHRRVRQRRGRRGRRADRAARRPRPTPTTPRRTRSGTATRSTTRRSSRSSPTT